MLNLETTCPYLCCVQTMQQIRKWLPMWRKNYSKDFPWYTVNYGGSGNRDYCCTQPKVCSHLFSASVHQASVIRMRSASRYQDAFSKPISGCVRMACDSLLKTNVLQVVKLLEAGCQNWLSTGSLQFGKTSRRMTSLIKLTSLFQLVDNFLDGPECWVMLLYRVSKKKTDALSNSN